MFALYTNKEKVQQWKIEHSTRRMNVKWEILLIIYFGIEFFDGPGDDDFEGPEDCLCFGLFFSGISSGSSNFLFLVVSSLPSSESLLIIFYLIIKN